MGHNIDNSNVILLVLSAFTIGISLGVIMVRAAAKKSTPGRTAVTGAKSSRAGALIAPAGGAPSAANVDLPPEVVALLPNQKIKAIKLLRNLTGVGLKQAKNSIEAYCAGHGNAATTHTGNGPDMPAEVLALLPGKKVEALKKYREITGLGLKESKDIIDAYCRQNNL